MIQLFSFPSKNQIRSMWASSTPEQPSLPHEIVVEILSRVPPKSLLKCRAVCKSWRSLISDSSFITLHRNHSSSFLLLRFSLQLHNPDSVPFLWPLNLYHHHHRHPLPPLLSYSNCPLHLPPPFDRDSYLAGICHGLLCFFNATITDCEYSSSFIICNPSIRKFISLPSPLPIPFLTFQSKYSQFVAFGFDSQNSDYKILRIIFLGHRGEDSIAEVYSLASGSWRILTPAVAPPCTISLYKFPTHGFCNGIAHWVAKRRVEDERGRAWWFFFVLSFDFVDEVFREVGLPDSLARAPYNRNSVPLVSVVGGGNKFLAVYHLTASFPYTGSIWVMKEYGVVESWDKTFQFDLTGSHLTASSFEMAIENMVARPAAALCVTNNGEKLLMPLDSEVRKNSMYSLDMEKKGFLAHEFGAPGWKLYPDYFEETLVLLDKDNAGALMPY